MLSVYSISGCWYSAFVNEDEFPHIDKKAFTISSLTDPSGEKDYWLVKTPSERLEALESCAKLSMATIHLPPEFKMSLRLSKEFDWDFRVGLPLKFD